MGRATSHEGELPESEGVLYKLGDAEEREMIKGCDVTHTPNILHVSINCTHHSITDMTGLPVEVSMKWWLAPIWY